MGKIDFKPGNMLYPLPAVLVTVRHPDGRENVLTVAWAGTVCSDPPMISISVRPERYSHDMIASSGEFAVNLTTRALANAADTCGCVSGRDVDKFELCKLTREPASVISAPLIAESPVNIECIVKQSMALGSHTMFIAEVAAVHVDDRYMDEKGRFALEKAEPIAYSHGQYFALGDFIGRFGFSVKKVKR